MTHTYGGSIKPVMIGDLLIEIPIIQGAMGVRISKSKLVSAVSQQGAMGVIASVGLGDETESMYEYTKKSNEALRDEIQKTRQNTNNPFGVNILVALSNYESLCQVCVEEKVSAIFSGAGLPLNLPECVGTKEVKLVPIVSSAKAAHVIIKYWRKKYDRLPDAFVVEGPLAGGHLGFSRQELDAPPLLTSLVRDVRAFLDSDENLKHIPIIAAGGIYSVEDIREVLQAGAQAVQMATRFITTHECDAPDVVKQACLAAKEEDVILVNSPVGLPGRVLRNDFVTRILNKEKIRFSCPYKCLRTCKQYESDFCIAQALVNAFQGNLDEGFIMPGYNVFKLDKIISVQELIEELLPGFITHGSTVSRSVHAK